MEIESLHPPDHTQAAEPGPSSARALYLGSERSSYKDAQVWKDIRAETGFASCADYLEFYKDVRPDFGDRLDELQELENFKHPSSAVIYDLSKQEHTPTRLTLRRHCHSGTELIQALRTPPGNVCLQLVLLDAGSFSREMADTMVLGLKLDPHILQDLHTVCFHQIKLRNYVRKAFRTSQVKHIRTNGTVAAISQNYMPDVAMAVPVLLIAMEIANVEPGLTLSQHLLAVGSYSMPPIPKPAREEMLHCGRKECKGMEKIGQVYASIVEQLMVRSGDATLTKAFQLQAAVLPLLYVEAHRIDNMMNELRDTHKRIVFFGSMEGYKPDERSELLDRRRLGLRRALEAAEDHVNQMFRYLGSEANTDWSKESAYKSLMVDWRNLIDEARRLESEVRDYMQLQVGNLALKESRKSIELSNAQIRETQRGDFVNRVFRKLSLIFLQQRFVSTPRPLQANSPFNQVPVTILAFIYVPLNLATSIFGMNIQQLNQSGQNLWAFITTAVVALLVTGGSWLCSDFLTTHEAVAWYKQRTARAKGVNDGMEEKRAYGLLSRIAMLVWLVRNGQSTWMWKTGAGIAILMNSKALNKPLENWF